MEGGQPAAGLLLKLALVISSNFLLQGILPTQELNSYLLHWQVDSLPLRYLGSPSIIDWLVHSVNIYLVAICMLCSGVIGIISGKWQLTSVFLPAEFDGWRSLVGAHILVRF